MSLQAATGVVITNPLVKYRALVATRAINPDPAQHRLAIHLQGLYERLKDYEPQVEYSYKLDQISRAIGQDAPRRWRSFLNTEGRGSLALTRRLTSLESAKQLESPKGLMLHGEVGTGKSMLVDLFADCLPTRKKRRWHFNNFMLETFAKLENMRRTQQDSQDYSMLRLARDMIETSPILFLDEFQLPDRAASKIMTNLMTSFFHLGGVLIATSNRMPEELAKAAGMEFGPAPQDLSPFGFRKKPASDRMFAAQNEFAGFLEVLKARCDVWEMEGANDYRRVESGSVAPVRDEDLDSSLDDDLGSAPPASSAPSITQPKHFMIQPADEDLAPAIAQALDLSIDPQHWGPAVLKVYGRTVPVPRSHGSTSWWTFDDLCRSTLGPADYITLASTYDTIILTDVPILTWLLKNEARRFITLLDALYECRCKLMVTAAAGPDDLFFPEKQSGDDSDAIYSETMADVYQDATAPFRPNILSQNPNYAEPDPEPDYTHARLAGLLNADALEDDPPNKPNRSGFARSFGRTDGEMEPRPVDHDEVRRPNFTKTSSFTGEDERFAYKRAQSRLWEMCGARWWARNEPGWHRPVPEDVRRWERPIVNIPSSAPGSMEDVSSPASDVLMGSSVEDNTRHEKSFKHASPFRTSPEPPPKIHWSHMWSTIKWGVKAGAWGQGVDGLKDRDKEKR
ncbi:hypothetical protein AMS68_002935 [Peltaster fructicola]|uniref:AAA+ ATPase domain-containing protein n=1 Tax=Peltaster fructicola TaxID=286661 RepID=A0A6H0XS14_9PEZI|nr:hypothetical protein AMS68_002935 [Peltaster fructicola]